ncbi:MAG: hypothetical protein IOD12_15275 [Silvanigrellales bacterium]|nr:hypothetical protein [Silvanigrellales bacterium]
MKKSTLFLALALSLPAVLTLAGIAAGLRHFDFESIPSPRTTPKGTEFDGLETMREDSVPVNPTLRVEAEGVRLKIEFDATLTENARLRVEARDFNGVTSTLSPEKLRFTRPSLPSAVGNAPPLVIVTLPATFASLTLAIDASRCQVEAAATTLRVETFRAETRASSCAFSFHRLEAREVSTRIEAGNASFDVRSLPPYTLYGKLRVGSLDLRYGDSHEHLSGLNHETRTEGVPGATLFDFEVSSGQLGVTLAAPSESESLRRTL